MEGRMVEEMEVKLVEEMEMVGGGDGRPKEGLGAVFVAVGGLLEMEDGRKNNERERRWECMCIYI